MCAAVCAGVVVSPVLHVQRSVQSVHYVLCLCCLLSCETSTLSPPPPPPPSTPLGPHAPQVRRFHGPRSPSLKCWPRASSSTATWTMYLPPASQVGSAARPQSASFVRPLPYVSCLCLTVPLVVNTPSYPGKNLLLYFSAHWCPPCQAFTPKLVKW